jgi:hypothetical protein
MRYITGKNYEWVGTIPAIYQVSSGSMSNGSPSAYMLFNPLVRQPTVDPQAESQL